MARQPGETNVIDLLRYRQSRKNVVLPLFDDLPRPGLVTIAPFRVLSAREVSHRARMLQHPSNPVLATAGVTADGRVMAWSSGSAAPSSLAQTSR